MGVDIDSDYIWIIVVGFIIAFVLAFGIGANDVANSFGTSVGAKVLTLRQACILASVFEILGAVLLGSKVSETIRMGIIEVEHYENNTDHLMLGNLASMSSCCVWMLAATLLKLPVSGTQSIIGATAGFALVMHGGSGMQWYKVGMIIASWFISPVFAGIVSVLLFFFCKTFILSKEEPLEPGLRWLPVFYSVTLFVNLLSIFYEGPTMLGFDKIPLWGVFVISIGLSILCGLVVLFLVVPWQRKKISAYVANMTEKDENSTLDDTGGPISSNQGDLSAEKLTAIKENLDHIKTASDKPAQIIDEPVTGHMENDSELEELQPGNHPEEPVQDHTEEAIDNDAKDEVNNARDEIKDRPETSQLFSFLQILTAVFGAFAHGGNDVSNSIGPLISLWLVATTNSVSGQHPTPIWILLYGGLGISVGLWVWGRKVIETIGEDLAKVTPSSGFCIELGSATTVLFASKVGIPISTTHCKVGSVVFVGRFRAERNVNWSIFRNIVLAWVVTMPVTGAMSAAIMAIFKALIIKD